MLAGEPAVSPVSGRRLRAKRALESVREHWYALGVAALTVGVGAFLLSRIQTWPPHEDETLVLFVSRQPLGDLFTTVISERGGAPLHFLLAHLVVTVSSGLSGLRLISIVFTVASVPVVAALAAKLTERRTALVATALVVASWMTVYHGLYGRMYGLFLFTSALSFLLLMYALDDRRPKTWALWAVAALAAIATQPYGALVVGVQAVYVAIRRWRSPFDVRPAAVAFAAVALVALPLWVSYRVLASRFEIGVIGEGNSKLGSPLDVLAYLGETAGDFTVGWAAATVAVGVAALVGLVTLVRTRPEAALLTVLVLVVPALALMAVRSGSSIGLESRHLIFALPFFALLVAAGLVRATAFAGRAAPLVLALAVVALVAGEIAWGWHKTPALYGGEDPQRTRAREAASAWLAETSRADDVLLGYEPLYLDAANRGAPFGEVVVPRADPRLMLAALQDAERPLGRGVWVFDATDEQDPAKRRFTIPARSPGEGFEARAFGPFLVLRTTEDVRTPERFVRLTIDVELLGRQLRIGDAGLNLSTALKALRRLEAG
jgi:Dolichyl-phosphate-mannose-protein mannosyltransferase